MTKHEQTRRDLELALYRIQKGRPKNITAERKLSIVSDVPYPNPGYS